MIMTHDSQPSAARRRARRRILRSRAKAVLEALHKLVVAAAALASLLRAFLF